LVNCKTEGRGSDNGTTKTGGFQFGSRTYEHAHTIITSEHHDQVLNAHYTWFRNGDIEKVAADDSGVTPTQNSMGVSGGDVIECRFVYSDVNEVSPLSPIRNHQVWAQADTTKTYRYYIQSNYTTNITDIKLTAEYLDTASSGHIATKEATATIAPRSNTADWSQYIEIEVTPAEDGWVRLQLDIYQYEASKYVWVDPEVRY